MLLNTGVIRPPSSVRPSNGMCSGSRPPCDSTTITKTRSGSAMPLRIGSVAAGQRQRRVMQRGPRLATEERVLRIDDRQGSADHGRIILSVSVGRTGNARQALRRVPMASRELFVAELVPATDDMHGEGVWRVERA